MSGKKLAKQTSMPVAFKRQWDKLCPRVWDHWEVGHKRWIIQDLDPADDEEALRLMLTHFVADEILCTVSGLTTDELSMKSMEAYWRACIAQRMTLGCYVEERGKKVLAALNCCIVTREGVEDTLPKVEGKAWINVYGAMKFVDSKVNAYKYLGTSTLLYGMGLLVRPEYRGAALGSRLLAARKPLCLSQGVTATTTVFSGPASQRSAEKAGFTTIATASMKEMAAYGLEYPEEDRVIKCMVKNYKD